MSNVMLRKFSFLSNMLWEFVAVLANPPYLGTSCLGTWRAWGRGPCPCAPVIKLVKIVPKYHWTEIFWAYELRGRFKACVHWISLTTDPMDIQSLSLSTDMHIKSSPIHIKLTTIYKSKLHIKVEISQSCIKRKEIINYIQT